MIAGLLVLAAAGCVHDLSGATFTVDQRIDGASSGMDPDSRGTKICVTTAGVVYVAWLDDREDLGSGALDVWLQRSGSTGEGGWFERPLKVNDQPGAGAMDLACDDSGARLAWERRDGTESDVWFDQYLDADGAVGDDRIANVVGPGLAPSVALVGFDTYVTWFQEGELHFLRSDDGLSWSIEDPIGVDVQGAALVTNRDEALVAWIDGEGGVHATEPVADTNARLALDADGHVQACAGRDRLGVVWQNALGEVWASSSPDTSGPWLEPARLDEGGALSSAPSCAVAGEDVVVAWSEGGSAATARTLAPSGSVGDITPLATAGPTSGLALAASPSAVVAAWTDARNAQDLAGGVDLFYTYRTDGWAGEDFRLDSMFDAGSWKVDLAIDAREEQVFAAWIDGRNGNGDVYFATYLLGEAASPPSLDLDPGSSR
jgi:hypothetical protein